MAFVTIHDPKRRDEIVKEFLRSRKKIQNQFKSERLGEATDQEAFSKLFKPITSSVDALRQAPQLPAQPQPQAHFPPQPLPQAEQQFPEQAQAEADNQPEEDIGELAKYYLNMEEGKDLTYGVKKRNGHYFIGDKQIQFVGDDIVVAGKQYEGTQGLWHLLTMKEPAHILYRRDDLEAYKDIMVNSNAIRHPLNPIRTVGNNRGAKWQTIVKPIWVEMTEREKRQRQAEKNKRKRVSKKRRKGGSLTRSCDSDSLLERLDKLLASRAAGNTGLRNEIISVGDELLRQNVLSSQQYKRLMAILK